MLFITEFKLKGDILDVELTRLDFGEIEDVVDNGQQRSTGIVYLADIIALLGSKIGFQTQMREADDRVHRSADLVAHVSEEFSFRLGGVFSGDLGFRQGSLDLC